MNFSVILNVWYWLSTIVLSLSVCSPQSYAFVESQAPIVVPSPFSPSVAYRNLIFLYWDEPFPELTLVHETYHVWQSRQSEWQEDFRNMSDPFARFRVEYMANTNLYMDDVRANCNGFSHPISRENPRGIAPLAKWLTRLLALP